ncbi:hypothetical protein C8N42_1892, partial [Celeribacter persicus]
DIVVELIPFQKPLVKTKPLVDGGERYPEQGCY